jgi:Family of unknown function (DUF6152)
MRAYLPIVCFVMAGFLMAASSPAFAHHGGSMFDMAHLISVRGTVTDFQWANPHVMIYACGPDQRGSARRWSIELRGNPRVVGKAGWNKDTIKSGDKLTFLGHPAKDGSNSMRLDKVVLANGMELYSEPHSWF